MATRRSHAAEIVGRTVNIDCATLHVNAVLAVAAATRRHRVLAAAVGSEQRSAQHQLKEDVRRAHRTGTATPPVGQSLGQRGPLAAAGALPSWRSAATIAGTGVAI